jgi:ParB family transcriptional regulator, chromosome partitioning protein
MQQQTVTADFRALAIDQLRESPTNPRRTFDEAKLQELAQSIRAQGILVPLIVREIEDEMFEVVAGARRFRAAQQAELFTVPVRVVELTNAEALELQLIENAIREDVHPYEEAMAYKALLETSEPPYDVASIALKTGRSVNHIYGRLRMAELIPEVAEVFQANQITAGHAVLIARLPQEQQQQALEAAFREDWRAKEKHVVSVRELAQWIRENVMLTLVDAVFDREDADLVAAAGACTTCSKRTGANAALFDDFIPQDDRCLSASCFREKVDTHIARQKQNTAGLIQITRAYYTNAKGEEQVLTRNEYTVIEPQKDRNGESAEQQEPCAKATSAIVVEGPGKRGEVVQVCADPECEVHGKPNHRAEQEAATRQRDEQWKRQQHEREKNRENNRRLLDAVLEKVPKTLTRDDYAMLLFGAIDRLEYEDWEAITERYKIDTDEDREPDAAAFELREKAQNATDAQIIRMLVEITLLRSGYSDEKLEAIDPLASAARRYNVSLRAKNTVKSTSPKCGPKAGRSAMKSRKDKKTHVENKAVKKVAQKGGAA